MNEKDKTDADLVKPIYSPAGLDLDPKPPNVVRVSKRAGGLVLLIGTAILGLFAYGGYRRQRLQEVAIADAGPKNVAPAIAAASEIAREIPAGNLATVGPANDSTGDKTTTLVPPEDLAGGARTPAGPTGQAARYRSPYVTPVASVPAPTPEQRHLAAAYEREQQALLAPTSTRQTTASTWMPEQADAAPVALPNLVARPASDPSTRPVPPDGYQEQNMQGLKRAFLSEARSVSADDYLKSTRIQPLSEYEIKAGWEIPAVLEQAINSDLPGEIKALVTSNVYDTATGRYLLIPQGSRLIGSYDSRVGYGQDGVQVAWNRIIYPDASSIDLSGMMGLDASGKAGLRDTVDHHYKRLIGFAVVTSLFSGAFQLSQSRRQSVLAYPSAGEIAGSAVGSEISELGAKVTRRNLNVQPTIKIPVGYKFNVRVNRDILFDTPYESHQVSR